MGEVDGVLLGIDAILLIASLGLVRREYRSGETLSMTAVVVVWVAYLAHVGVTLWFAWTAPIRRLAFPPATAHLVGAFVAGFGTAVAADGIATFASFERMSGLQADELVTEGIYRYSRNPQNLGWGLALLGAAVAGRSVSALLMAGVFAAAVHGYLVWLEEPHLEKVFGEVYRDYRESAPRYLGCPSERDATG
ncbi:MAG: isoprenylcysteine carboxylmethyltransferase family protein [Bradymonadaceae bacterium]